MPRDIEADVKVNDKTAPGLSSVERRFKQTGDKIQKDYERFGTSAGNGLLRGIGAVSPKLAQKIASSVGDGAKLGGPLLASGIAAGLPVLSGLIGAAVIGGSAGLGILGGVALASRDARVQAAGDSLGKSLLSGLESRAGSFVQPVLRSIDLIERKFAESGDTIESIFENSSRFVEPLTDAVTDALQDMAEGVDTAIGRGAPVMASLNDGVRDLGSTIEGFIDDVTSNGEASARNLDSAFSSANGAIKATGVGLGAVNSAFGFLDEHVARLSLFDTFADVMDRVNNEGQEVGTWVEPTADGIQRAAEAADEAARKTAAYERAMRDSERASRDLVAAQGDLFADETRVGEAVDRVSESVRRNGKTLDANTEKGRANREALSGMASTLNGYRSNLQRSGATTETVNKTLENHRSQLIRAARQTGLNKQAAAELADKLLGIPKRVDTDSKFDKKSSSAAAAAYKKQLDGVPRNITTTLTVNVNASRLASVERRLARAGGEYAGGHSFAPAASDGTVSRTGGPVQVTSSITNVVKLDGRPFREMTARAIADSEARQNYRRRFGGRY